MTLAVRKPVERVLGVTAPRVAPPAPAGRSKFTALAKALGINLFPWQKVAGRYMVARQGDHWRYRDIVVVVGRQNGKTELLLPRISLGLERGERILHTAQNRTLPRKVFMRIAQLAMSRDDVFSFRQANGQEELVLKNGGSYTIVAPKRGGRGLSADLLIYDEVREFEDYDVIGAIGPTQTASLDPQTIYLSNAGSDASVVLNDLKRRSEDENGEDLAYLEWSAALERSLDDRTGWAEANPALGYMPSLLRVLEQDYKSMPPAVFETEHLCRWVASMQPRLVGDAAWMQCRTSIEETPNRPAIAFNMDPSGRRASAVMAWQMTDGRIACVELAEVTGDPIDLPRLGKELKEMAAKHGAKKTAFASWTDKDLARYVPRSEPLDAKEFANASENFARLVLSRRLAWDGATHITDDLTWTARKPHDSGAWQAVPATAERSVTAVLAAIRATWLASAPRTVPRIG